MKGLAPVLYEEIGRVVCITINREKRAAELGERAPLSLNLTKTVTSRSAISSYSEIVTLEGELQEQCMHSNDFREGVSEFFEKRKPTFQGE